MKEQKKMNNKGFSLVELIIVIAIMAILVGVLAPQYIKYVEKSRQSTDLQNMEAIKTAVEAAVASGDLTANVTVSVSTTAITVDATVAGKLDGVSASTTLKSSGWTTAAYTYSVSDYKWTCTGTTANSKDPKEDMKTVFGIATSSTSAGS